MTRILILVLALSFFPSVAYGDEAALLEEIDALRVAAEGFQSEAKALRDEADELRIALASKDEVILNLNLSIESLRTIISTHESDLAAKEQERMVAYMNWKKTEKELADYLSGKVQPAERGVWIAAVSGISMAFAATLIKNASDASASN